MTQIAVKLLSWIIPVDYSGVRINSETKTLGDDTFPDTSSVKRIQNVSTFMNT